MLLKIQSLKRDFNFLITGCQVGLIPGLPRYRAINASCSVLIIIFTVLRMKEGISLTPGRTYQMEALRLNVNSSDLAEQYGGKHSMASNYRPHCFSKGR